MIRASQHQHACEWDIPPISDYVRNLSGGAQTPSAGRPAGQRWMTGVALFAG